MLRIHHLLQVDQGSVPTLSLRRRTVGLDLSVMCVLPMTFAYLGKFPGGGGGARNFALPPRKLRLICGPSSPGEPTVSPQPAGGEQNRDQGRAGKKSRSHETHRRGPVLTGSGSGTTTISFGGR
jgi:hypothetical protein